MQSDPHLLGNPSSSNGRNRHSGAAHVGAEGPTIREIDTMLAALTEQRRLLASNERLIQLELLRRFLSRSKLAKERQLRELMQTINSINSDLAAVDAELSEFSTSPSTLSVSQHLVKDLSQTFSSVIDSQNVPSTPITTNPAIQRASASITTASSEMDESEPHVTPPPLIEIASDPHPHRLKQSLPDPMQRLLRSRMTRVDAHFDNLLENYCEWRRTAQIPILHGSIPMTTNIQIPTSLSSFTPASLQSSFTTASLHSKPSISNNLISTDEPLLRGVEPFSASCKTFAESLSCISRVSSYKTLARINYADKLVSGTGSGGIAGGGSSGNGSGGPSSIVSAIEFDRDDEFFATAGVTRKVKIYEFESVVKDWTAEFGGGGNGDSHAARRKGFVTKPASGPVFVTDSLRDDPWNKSSTGANGYAQKSTDGSDNEDEDDDVVDTIPRYPILEMNGRSKISCLSWNSHFKSHLAASDYEGIVTLWDSTSGRAIQEFEEHEKRVWSVDFNTSDPLLLASGSDDCKVKIWSANQRGSVQTIESKANICSVKWNPVSERHIAFGSADHHIHYYDLRNAASPLYILEGHKKAVSYVKFISSNEIVSASTDSTLKLWSLGISSGDATSKTMYDEVPTTLLGPITSPFVFGPLSTFIERNLTENILQSDIFRKSVAPGFQKLDLFNRVILFTRAASVLSLPKTPTKHSGLMETDTPFLHGSYHLPDERPRNIRSFSGHVNEKNFVGLSVNCSGDFIACGSENNSVYTYSKNLVNPLIVHRFGNALDTVTGLEVADADPYHFVSSVCWKKKDPDVLMAANSVGGVKVMKMV
ncbi:coatomer subunit alpha [Chytriomyces hyalinus]|nr:coatomer subunit alpha [Chytriomyces hyalinus]